MRERVSSRRHSTLRRSQHEWPESRCYLSPSPYLGLPPSRRFGHQAGHRASTPRRCGRCTPWRSPSHAGGRPVSARARAGVIGCLPARAHSAKVPCLMRARRRPTSLTWLTWALPLAMLSCAHGAYGSRTTAEVIELREPLSDLSHELHLLPSPAVFSRRQASTKNGGSEPSAARFHLRQVSTFEEPAQQRVVSLAHGCIAERARTAGTRASDVEP